MDATDGLELLKLPFAQRWEEVGNPATRVQINAKHIALNGPTTDSGAYRAWYDSLGDLSTEPNMKIPSPIPDFSRTDSSIKLSTEYKPNTAGFKGRRASIVEAGNPFRRASAMKRISGGAVNCELPKWKPLHPGCNVQVLDRPDWLQRVRSGLEGLHSRPRSSPDLGNERATGQTDAFSRTAMTDEEQELQRQRRLKQLEKVRKEDTSHGEFDDIVQQKVMSLGTVEVSETFQQLKDFAERAQERGRKTYGSLIRKKSKKTYQTTEAEWAIVEEFWEWCKSMFGDLTKAFFEFDLNRSGSLSSVEFADGLRSKGYPGNETTYKNIFFLFDADQDGVIGKQEFMGSKLRAPKIAEDTDNPSGDDERKTSKTHDPFETHFKGVHKSKSVIESKRASIVQTLWKQDPLVSQFIQHLFISYKTLKQAFREIDINRNGLLSKSEFKDGLRILKVGTRSMLENHVDDLFDRLDLDNSGSITLDEMTADTADPLVKRLVKYLTEVRKDFHSRHENESSKKIDPETLRVNRLGRVFDKLDDDTSKAIDREEFIAAMKRMRYVDWHANDLFDRLDKDKSGQLDAGEFTAFLENQPASKKREPSKERKASKTPADQTDELQEEATKRFQEKFETGAASLMFNMKLQRIGYRSATVDKVRLGLQSGATEAKAGGWTTDTSGVSVQVREDYIAKVREQLVLPRNSKLRATGGMSFGVSPEHPGDHLPLCMGMSSISRHPVARPQSSSY